MYSLNNFIWGYSKDRYATLSFITCDFFFFFYFKVKKQMLKRVCAFLYSCHHCQSTSMTKGDRANYMPVSWLSRALCDYHLSF